MSMEGEVKQNVKKLSKGVLELKFMKKTKEKAVLQEENEERQQLYQDQLSLLHKGADRIVMVDSYFDCMDFLPCRLSFGGMDPDIEKLNEDKLTGVYKTERILPAPNKGDGIEEDVTAEEIAENYSKLLGNKAKQFTKRKSDHNEFENSDDPQKNKYFKGNATRGKRPIFTNKEFMNPQGRGGFTNKGRGDFNNRGQGDFSNRGRGDFSNRGRGSYDDRRGEGGQSSVSFSPGLKKLKFMNPQECENN